MKSLNKTYTDILGDAYKNYCKNVSDEIVNVGDTFIDTKRNLISTCRRKEIGTSKKVPILICEYEGCYIEEDCKKILSQEQFINKIKTDNEFAKEWDVVIETKDLAVKDRLDWTKRNHPNIVSQEGWFDLYEDLEDAVVWFNSFDIGKVAPTKVITITYKNETIVSYE